MQKTKEISFTALTNVYTLWYNYNVIKERRKNIMKKFLKENKGIIIFYLIIIVGTLLILQRISSLN